MQGISRNLDMENRLWTQWGKGGWGKLREQRGNIYIRCRTDSRTLLCVTGTHTWLRDNLEEQDWVGCRFRQDRIWVYLLLAHGDVWQEST